MFRVTTFSILIALAYFVVLVFQVYSEQQNTKPPGLVDLPVFSQIWWLPVLSASLLFILRSQVRMVVRPIFKIYGKDKHDVELYEA